MPGAIFEDPNGLFAAPNAPKALGWPGLAVVEVTPKDANPP
eukprot:CAMPEP_0183713846 /NCGR_PEP_ID=MMETSP0737-20130205/8594_1 /TAXON_ID=385413 /ORGANISM="Thalassiosira miniscula, Strain CCMP1093" /LENGTH=40 /DNA_ID= /DNA_START= /DNA_END= /DNA_ORIENTATION=